jgi:hypothetical protein
MTAQARGPPVVALSAFCSWNAKDRAATRSLKTTARERPHMKMDRTVPPRRTDSRPVLGVCVPLWSAGSIASTAIGGAGDGLQPDTERHRSAPSLMAPVGVVRGFAVSYRAIACALALEDVSIGERLVAFSLASYANRAHLAWPSARTAAARAALGRRQYLAARDRLIERGLITREDSGGGAVIRLAFAEAGPSVEREVNAELFEAVLSRNRARGGARALLGALAALASVDGVVDDVSTEELCEASGLSDRTYRRARAELLARGEVRLEHAGGGRGCQNVWRVLGTGAAGDAVNARAVRRAPAPCQLPLVAAVREEPAAARKEPPVRGKSGRRGPGIPGRNPGVLRARGVGGISEPGNQTPRPPFRGASGPG